MTMDYLIIQIAYLDVYPLNQHGIMSFSKTSAYAYNVYLYPGVKWVPSKDVKIMVWSTSASLKNALIEVGTLLHIMVVLNST